MGKDTNAILDYKINIEELEKYLSSKYKEVEITEDKNFKNYKIVHIEFKDGIDDRILRILINDEALEEDNYPIDCITSLTLGCWGHSVKIIEEILQNFEGGYMKDDDYENREYRKVEAKK